MGDKFIETYTFEPKIEKHLEKYSSSTPTPTSASDVDYDNTQSGLPASNVQSAIDEVNGKVENLSSPVVPKGTLAFASLPSLASVEVGWMYNISDDFTTTSDFVISGISEKAGSNVYCVEVDVSGEPTKKWDVFAVAAPTVVDQHYNPSSANAQSGKAVAEAINANITNVLYQNF